jgi:hypothetical protein
MSGSIRDPFYSVKDKVNGLISQLRSDVEAWEKLSSSSPDYATITQSIKHQVKAINIDVNDLSQTILIVEQNRSRFPGIDDRELDSRKNFVTEMNGLLAAYKQQLHKAKQRMDKEKQPADGSNNTRRQLLNKDVSSSGGAKGKSRFDSAIANESNRERDDYVDNMRQSQLTVEQKQDEVLGGMSEALGRLMNLSEDINVELKTHEQMLNELDDNMGEAQDRMQVVLKKLDKLLKSSDKGRLCCIVILFFLAILLFFLIIYA